MRQFFMITVLGVALLSCLEAYEHNITEFIPLAPSIHEDVRNALLKLDITERDLSYVIAQKIRLAHGEGTSKRVYETLVGLANNEMQCPNELIEYTASIYMQEELAYYRRFIRNHDHIFSYCAMDALQDIKARVFATESAGKAVMESFEKLFIAAMGFDPKQKNAKTIYYHRLPTFDLCSRMVDTIRMTKAILGKTKSKMETSELITEALNDRCELFDARLRQSFASINLAIRINRFRLLDESINRLNEYYRLCLIWADLEGRQKISANLLQSAIHDIGHAEVPKTY